MTIQIRATTTPSVDSSSPYTVNKPSGTLEGDLLLASVVTVSSSINQVLPPDGWFAVRGAGINGDDNISCWYKVAGDSEPSTYDFTSNSNSIVGIGILALYSDAAAEVKIDAVATQVNASGDRVYPSVTFTAAGLLVCMGAVGAGSTGSSTPPGGMGEHWDTTLSGNRSYCMTGAKSAGASGTQTATGTTAASKCISIALIEGDTEYPGVRFRGSTNTGPSNVTSDISLTMPANIAAGDMLLAHLTLNEDRTVTTPAGWTLQANLATTGAMRVFSKIATGAEAGANLTIAFTGGSTTASLAVSAFWSPDGATLQIGDVATASDGSAATHDFPTVTAEQDGAALVMLTSKDQTTQYKLTNGLDMWERYDYGASSIRTSMFSEYLLATGATGTRTAALTSGSAAADLVSLLIEPIREGILLNGVDLTDHLTSWRLEANVREAPTTVLSSQAAERIAIISDWLFSCAGLWSVAVDDIFGGLAASSQDADSTLFVEVRQAHLPDEGVAYESSTAFVARYRAPIATIDGVLVWEATVGISGAPTRSVL